MSSRRAAIIELHLANNTNSKITKSLGVSRQLVSKTIKRFKETGSLTDRPRSGRPKTATTPANVKSIRNQIDYDPKRSARKMAKKLGIGATSVRRILKNKLNRKPFKLRHVQSLTDVSKRNRLIRCRALKKGLKNGRYQSILFTDEKIFTIEQTINKQNDRVWLQEPSAKHQNKYRKQGAQSVMAWAGISATGRTPLVFIEQGVKVNKTVYLEKVLKGVVQPWAKGHFKKKRWTFQQDSAPSHKAKVVQEWCTENFPEFINVSQWPASSPDLNPTDYFLWGVLEFRVCGKPQKNLASLKQQLKKEWEKIPQQMISDACDDFVKRLQSCIQAKGGHFE